MTKGEAEEWSAQECADYLEVKLRTWHSYVYRPARDNPAPQPKRWVGRTPVWDAHEVREWKKARPGQGNRQPR
ncbi:transcriptional regulator [Nocardia transvalensis]|uniref:transcriptional regulator n=1 Tax=Nocardia transvalensis TaxID=37333 RepID=UPI001892E969|nr:transcriptional regulator [Nocardia transvalensis]MBF6332461.1 transcriptional regulator [Nocardia transvalensis]